MSDSDAPREGNPIDAADGGESAISARRTKPMTRSRRRAVPIALALTTAAALGVGTGFAEAHKTITVVRDGRPTTFTTFAGTVGAALGDGKVTLAGRDHVHPAVGEALPDGATITIKTAKDLTFVDSDGTDTVVTNAVTAEEAAREAETRGSSVVVSRSERRDDPALRLALSTGEQVDLVVAGTTSRVTNTSPDLGSLLKANDVTVEFLDRVELGQADDGVLRVTVTTIRQEQRTRSEPVPFEKKRKKDASLPKGEKKVTTKGVAGSAQIVELVTLTNGQVSATVEQSRRITKPPVTQVTSIGTSDSSATDDASSGSAKGGSTKVSGDADSLNWAALARCESGGRASVVSSNGLYHGLYQFSVATWRSVGGTGLPSKASAAEQTKRAKILYTRSGAGQWPHCGRYLR